MIGGSYDDVVDAALSTEIELLADVITAACLSTGPMSPEEIDQALGLRAGGTAANRT